MPVTEQVPYGKPTTEALGWPAGEPVNKRLASHGKRRIPARKLAKKGQKNINWKTENEWRLQNDKCKQITN